MLHSMTGFGQAEAHNDFAISVEIKSVNNRYLETSFRLPSIIQTYENELRALLQKSVSRGKVFVAIKIEQEAHAKIPSIDSEKLTQFLGTIKSIQKALGKETEISHADILPYLDLLSDESKSDNTAEHIFAEVKPVFEAAVSDFVKQRMAEGKNLCDDLLNRLQDIEENLSAIGVIAKDRVDETRQRLHERIANLLQSDEFDKDRLEMEIAIIADKLDITEEIVRLNSHISFFDKALNSSEPAGRKLNFLVQEINREIHSIGS